MKALLSRFASRLLLFPPMVVFLGECIAIYYFQIWPKFPSGFTEFKEIFTFIVGALFEIWLVIVTVAAVLVWFWEKSEFLLYYAERIERREKAIQRQREETEKNRSVEPVENFESPNGLDPDVWLLIIAKLQLLSVARLSMVSRFFQHSTLIGLTSIQQYDIWNLSVDSKTQLARNRPDTGADDWLCRLLMRLERVASIPHLTHVTFPPTAPYILQEMIERTSKLNARIASLRCNRVLSEMPGMNQVSHQDTRTAISLALEKIWTTPSFHSSLTSLDLHELSGYAKFKPFSNLENLINLVELLLPTDMEAPIHAFSRLTRLTRLSCLLENQYDLVNDDSEAPEEFPRFLRDLRLHSIPASPLLWKSFTRLQNLKLDYVHVSEMDWSLLRSATSLERLDLSNSNLGDRGFDTQIFQALPRLQRLDPSVDPLTDPQLMNHLTRIAVDLNASYQECITLICACRTFGYIHNLQSLEFSFETKSHLVIDALYSGGIVFPRLHTFKFTYTYSIDDSDTKEANKSLIKFIEAHTAAAGAPWTSLAFPILPDALRCAVDHFRESLTSLSLEYLRSSPWKGEWLPEVARLTNLRKLKVHCDQSKLSDDLVALNLLGLSHLEHLSLSNSTKNLSSGIKNQLRSLPAMKYFLL